MPCRDYYDDHPDQFFKDHTEPALKKQISFAESALCQTLAAFEKVLASVKHDYDDTVDTDVNHYIDFKAAGITMKELNTWWKEHKAIDEKLRAEEAAKKNAKQLRKSALAKLTDEEKLVLGIK